MNIEVIAKIAMDEELKIKYAAFALGGMLPCGYYETKQEAIAAGEAWQRSHNKECFNSGE